MDGKNGMTGSRVEEAELQMGEIPDTAAAGRSSQEEGRKAERKKSNSNGKMAETPKSRSKGLAVSLPPKDKNLSGTSPSASYLQRPAERFVNLAKQDPGRARQNS